jgi:hypothetical protein
VSDYDDYDENDNNPGDLRKALEKFKKAAKEAEARAAAAEERAANAEKSVKSQSLASLLSERKVPAGLAKFMGDTEATAEAVDAWLKENGELFNLKPKADAEPADEQDDEQDEVPEDLANALDLSAQLDAQGASAPLRGVDKAIHDLPDNLSYEEGLAQMRALGVVK